MSDADPMVPEDTEAVAAESNPDSAEFAARRAAELMLLGALSEVYDPEIGIDLVSLGLIYGVALDEAGVASVDLTLTSPYCPMGSIIQSQAHAVLMPLPGVESVSINLVWSPPWDPRTMASEEARLQLGIY